MKKMNVVRRFGTTARNVAIAATGAVIASPSFAALEADAVTALETAKADAQQGGGLVLAAVAVVAGIALVIAIFRKA
ncbi:hypothetical protein LCGC14_1140630 [marine sediment metagenome]|uniref:Uncharacterized protein n=1 Tax=marine sediment metagenome TaxID=412755 RepID=A0A0F9DX34_9ZZZZ